MATTRTITLTTRNSLLRPIALGGLSIGILHLIIQEWIVYSLVQGNPFISVQQYIASALIGNAAFAGGIATALLGTFLHFCVSFVIAGVFILSADRIPFLRRYAIAAAFLYGFGVFLVMNMIVLPFSAAPPLPAPTVPQLIEMIIDHILVIGVPLAFLVQRNARTATGG
jgi:hypothetical protein